MKILRLPLLHLAACSLLAAPFSAQVLRVKAGAPLGGDGTSWARAFADLQAALAVASVTPGVEIWVAAGKYRPTSGLDRTATFSLPDRVSVFGGFAGTELARNQRDPRANVTILDGDLNGDDLPGLVNYGDNSMHVVSALQVQSFVLDGFTVRGGSVGEGAGIRVHAQRAELANLVVTENHGLGNNDWGGGMFLLVDFASLTNCQVTKNRATSGAGVLLRGPNLVLVDCVFEGNSGTGGAGVDATEDQFAPLFGRGSMQAIGCRFVDNEAVSGAGVRFGTTSPWDADFIACTFLDGFGLIGTGVALTTRQGGGELRTVDCLFQNNVACTGGGIYVRGAHATVERCRFVHNGYRTCTVGGGGGSIKGLGALVDITDSSFFDDRPASVWIDEGSSAAVSRSTLLGTSTGGPPGSSLASAAIRVISGVLFLEDTIVWGGFDGQVSVHSTLGSVSASYSDVRGGLPGTGNLNVDPLFVNAAAGNLHLLPGSPCIDAGRPGFRQAGEDLDRDSRLLDGNLDGRLRLDIGADEHSPYRLEVQGTPAPGSTLTYVTSGPPGLSAVLLFGRPGLQHVAGIGTLFVDLNNPLVRAWSAPPSSVQVVVPPGVHGLFHTQVILFGGGVILPTNYVPQEF